MSSVSQGRIVGRVLFRQCGLLIFISFIRAPCLARFGPAGVARARCVAGVHFRLGHGSTGDSGGACAMFFSPLSLGFAAPTDALAASGLCDIAAAAGNPCVAAHSTVRAMYSSYSGALYQVKRSDNSTMDVKVLTQGGYVDAKAQDTFCGAANCVIESIYDQSPMGNHLAIAPPGGAHRERDAPVNATADPLIIGGHRAYSAYFEGGMGYRSDKTRGVATGDEARTVCIQP